MSADYHAIAGQSLERLAALSDGVFAIAMTLLPFSTGLLAEFFPFRSAVVIYWLNLLLLGLMLWWSIRYAWRAGLMKDTTTSEQRLAQERRILSYQALYAVSMLLCVVNPALSIAGLILLQISSILSPRLGLFSRR